MTRFDPASLTHPIVSAPMAGGTSTPELAAAVSEAGGLGFLAAGYKEAGAVRDDVAALRSRTAQPFGLNVFAPPGDADADVVARYEATLREESERIGVPLGRPRHHDDGWEAKLELAIAERIPVVSFAFGCPPEPVVRDLHDAGAAVWVTVTMPAEAREAARAGADALVAQGHEAGAVAACLGTGFLHAREAGTSPVHRGALGTEEPTALTRAFTGRTARGIVNRFLAEHSADAPSGYPDVHHITSPLRAAARDRGDPDLLHLWAGQSHALVRDVAAGAFVAELADGARRVLREAAERV